MCVCCDIVVGVVVFGLCLFELCSVYIGFVFTLSCAMCLYPSYSFRFVFGCASVSEQGRVLPHRHIKMIVTSTTGVSDLLVPRGRLGGI